MTTVAAFNVIPNMNTAQQKDWYPQSVYVLADSQISWLQGKRIVKKSSGQKVFFDHKASLIWAYSGDAEGGNRVMQAAFATVFSSSKIRYPVALQDKVDAVKEAFDLLCNDYLSVGSIEVVFATVFEEQFSVFKLNYAVGIAQSSFTDLTKRDITLLYHGGSGGTQFEIEYDTVRDTNDHIPQSACLFKAFNDFIDSKQDVLSSGPCQGAFIAKDGTIKVISLKRNDEFYILGEKHSHPMRLDHEIDFRDTEFEYLHPDGRIRGGRKKYVFL